VITHLGGEMEVFTAEAEAEAVMFILMQILAMVVMVETVLKVA